MSLITYNGLAKLVADGVIRNPDGAPIDHKRINAASIDVTLGDTIWLENESGGTVDLANREGLNVVRSAIDDEHGFPLYPGEFVLAQTYEQFFLPDDVAAEFRLNSSGARNALDQALAVWCDPGWNGSVLTLELRNNSRWHRLLLRSGMRIGQMVFWRGERVPADRSYASVGRYNGDTTAAPSKGVER